MTTIIEVERMALGIDSNRWESQQNGNRLMTKTKTKTTKAGKTEAQIKTAEASIIGKIRKNEESRAVIAKALASLGIFGGSEGSFQTIADAVHKNKGVVYEWAVWGAAIESLKALGLDGTPINQEAAKELAIGMKTARDFGRTEAQVSEAMATRLRSYAAFMAEDTDRGPQEAACLATGRPEKIKTKRAARPAGAKAKAKTEAKTEAKAKTETPAQTADRLRADWVKTVNGMDADDQAKAIEAMRAALEAWAV